MSYLPKNIKTIGFNKIGDVLSFGKVSVRVWKTNARNDYRLSLAGGTNADQFSVGKQIYKQSGRCVHTWAGSFQNGFAYFGKSSIAIN